MTVLLAAWIWMARVTHIHSQTCLSSPQAVTHDAVDDDIEWTELDANTFAATFVFDVSSKFWFATADGSTLINAQITTRLFNHSLPSQTLRFRRGNQYRITLINSLGPESANNPTEHNVPKDPNTTNIHTHGLHISGEGNGDNVFLDVAPGESHTYIYNIPCNHAGGTFFWHPHHHGSTHLQCAAGAVGALIIEDDAEQEGLADWYHGMEELLVFISHMHLDKIGSMTDYDWDYVWTYDRYLNPRPLGEFDNFFVNGQFQPTICLTAGKWMKLRFAQLETTEKSRIYYIGHGECTVYLLARDGVMVHGMNNTDMPRAVGHGVWLAHSSRADVAVSCPGHSSGRITHELWVEADDGNNQTIAYLRVSGLATSPSSELTPFSPIRPHYLENLLSGYYTGDLPNQTYPVERYWGTEYMQYWETLQITGSTIDGRGFISETDYLQYIGVNTINTWEVTTSGNNLHPLHVHINHFQILSSQLATLTAADYPNWVDIPDGYQVVGDWVDTVWGPAWIRFKTDTFGGTVTLHCHILIHEDQGAMGTVLIVDGCDNNYEGYNGSTCDYVDTCAATTTAPTTAPTIVPTSPTREPSMNPTESPALIETADPTKLPTVQPTVRPTAQPTGDPTTQPTTPGPSTVPTACPSPQPTTTMIPTYGPTREQVIEPTAQTAESVTNESHTLAPNFSTTRHTVAKGSRPRQAVGLVLAMCCLIILI